MFSKEHDLNLRSAKTVPKLLEIGDNNVAAAHITGTLILDCWCLRVMTLRLFQNCCFNFESQHSGFNRSAPLMLNVGLCMVLLNTVKD